MSNTAKWIIGLVVVVLVIVGVVSATGEESNQGDNNPVKVGAILPVSGELSAIGEGEKNGLLLAKQRIDEKYPKRNIELEIKDFQSQTKNAASIAQQMLNQDYDAIITSTTAAAEAVSPILESTDIKHFVISPDADILNKADNNYRIYYSFLTEANKVKRFISNNNAETVSFLGANYSSIVKEIDEIITPYLEENNISVTLKEFFNVSEQDFRTNISKAKNESADVMFMAPQVNQVKSLTTQAEEQNFTPRENDDTQFLGSFTFNWAPKEYLQTLEGYYIVSPRFQIESASSSEVAGSYAEKYGSEPSFDTMYAYDNLMVLTELLVQTNGNDKPFEKAFNNYGTYEGASGKITFTGERDTDVEIVLTEIENGKQVLVGTSTDSR